MKFIAALIATAAAVKTHGDMWDTDLRGIIDLSNSFDLNALSDAAQALAD